MKQRAGSHLFEADLVAGALDQTDAGMDFADALHLGRSARCEKMATFDSRFVQAASATRAGFVAKIGGIQIEAAETCAPRNAEGRAG